MSRPSVRSALVVLGAVTLVVIGMATPAQAHAIITSSQPEPGQRLGTAPGVVVLELSEPLNPKLSRATVTDPTGQRFTGGVSGEREIRVSLSTNAQGVYRVDWTTVSTLDGHAVRGSFQFGVGVSPGGAAETGGGATPTREDLIIAVARWVESLALLLAVGMLFLRRLVRGRPELSWARPRLIRPVLLVALAGGVAVVVSEAASAAGSASPAALWNYLSTGLPGLARLLRLGLEALAVSAAFLGAPSIWLWVTGALVALASSGHGAAVHPIWWGITVDAVHLVAAGMWAGGILAMATLRPPGGWRSKEARVVLVRFSPPALAAFAVTVGFGAIQALQELGAVRALTGSRYGQVLLVKIALVGLMVPLSVVAWRLRRPHLRYEGTIAVLVVAAAAVLAAFPVPPSRLVEEEAARAVTPSASAFPGPGDLTMGGHAGQVLVGLTLDPGEAGTNRALVYLLPLEGNEAAANFRAHLLIGELPVPLSACGDTCRRATVAVQGGEEIRVRVDGRRAGRPPSIYPSCRRQTAPPSRGRHRRSCTASAPTG
jgi:copper transport protein